MIMTGAGFFRWKSERDRVEGQHFIVVIYPTVPTERFKPYNLRGGGGGLFCPDHQIIDQNSKTALSSTFKLGDFLFLSISHILAEF